MEFPEREALVRTEQREAGAAQVATNQDGRVGCNGWERRSIGARRPSRVRESQARPQGFVDLLGLRDHLASPPDEVDSLLVQPPQLLHDLAPPNVHHATLTWPHGVKEAVHPVGIVAEVGRWLG